LRLNEFYYGKANKLQAFNSTQAWTTQLKKREKRRW
jgi:hypothetical protein